MFIVRLFGVNMRKMLAPVAPQCAVLRSILKCHNNNSLRTLLPHSTHIPRSLTGSRCERVVRPTSVVQSSSWMRIAKSNPAAKKRKDDTRNVFIFYYVEENIDLGPWARVASGLRMAGPASPLAGLTKSFGEAMADGWPSH